MTRWRLNRHRFRHFTIVFANSFSCVCSEKFGLFLASVSVGQSVARKIRAWPRFMLLVSSWGRLAWPGRVTKKPSPSRMWSTCCRCTRRPSSATSASGDLSSAIRSSNRRMKNRRGKSFKERLEAKRRFMLHRVEGVWPCRICIVTALTFHSRRWTRCGLIPSTCTLL